MKKISILLMVLGLVLLISGCGSDTNQTETDPEPASPEPAITQQPIKIGFMGPLSGEAASYGESILEGVQLSFDNSNDDLVRSKVELIVEDSKCDPKEAVSAVNKLISVDNVQVIIGEVCSSATLAAAAIARDNGVAMISAASTSPEISKFQNVFRTVPSDEFQGIFGAEYAASKGYSKMGYSL